MTLQWISGFRFAVVAALAALLAAPALADPQSDYPNRTIKIIVPLPPGATADTLPRIIGEKLTEKWGQPVVVENRPGAAQNLGAEAVARAEPDGYTLLATPQGPLVISQHFYAKLGFDPAAFVPVTVMGMLPYVLVVNPKVPFTSLQEMIAYAKAHPDKLTYASPGAGSASHLATEWLKMLAGIHMTHVPYRGAAPGLTDLIGGHVDIMFANFGNVVEPIKAGKLRALAVTTRTRVPELAGTPAIAELFPEFEATSWFAVVAPPHTPPAIAAKLQAAMAEALKMPDIRQRMRDLGTIPSGISPAETATLIANERARWEKIIHDAGIKPE